MEGLPGLLVQEFWTDPVQALLWYRAAERVRRAPWHPEGFSHLLPTAYQAVLETERGALELLPKVVFDDSELFYEFFLGYRFLPLVAVKDLGFSWSLRLCDIQSVRRKVSANG